MKKLLLSYFLVLTTSVLLAQTPPSNPAPAPAGASNPAAAATTDDASKKGSAIGFNLSTDGVGLQFAQNLNTKRNIAVRVGGMYLPYTITNMEFDFDGTVLVMNGDVKLGSLQALFDYHPFNNAFKLTGGVAYMLTNVSATALSRDSVKMGEIMLSPTEIGKIDVGVKVGPICPYVGLGFGRAVPKSRFSFNFEVGAYYINQPKITFAATGMLEPSSVNEKVLQSNVSGYKWLPLMNFGFNFRLGK